MIKPVLVFAYGNLSRGDDALGPLLLEYVENHCDLEKIELLTDFQLQVEHALDLDNRELVMFVDASVACMDTFAFERLVPERDKSYTTHAMSPASVLAVYQSINKKPPPMSFLLSIKGEEFELGGTLSEPASQHLAKACEFAFELLNNLRLDFWEQKLNATPATVITPAESARPVQHA